MDGVIGQPVNPATTNKRSSSNRNLTKKFSQLFLGQDTSNYFKRLWVELIELIKLIEFVA